MRANKIKNNAKKFFWFLAVHAFWTVLALVLAGLALGDFLFYKYVVTLDNQVHISSGVAGFQEDIYAGLLKQFQLREEKFKSN